MAIRGVYTEEEKKLLEDFEKSAGMLSGWDKNLSRAVGGGGASEESIKNMAIAVDWSNPLYNDEKYAAYTRWGSIIAPPMYPDCFKPATVSMLVVPPTIGHLTYWYLGEAWEFFKPIRANDSIKVWRRRPKLEDITDLDGKGPRKFSLLDIDFDLINQRDELVNTIKLYAEITILSEPQNSANPSPEYTYTEEELQFIDRIANEEEVRGADIRYWEDVRDGEDTKPVCFGPSTVWDMVVFQSGRFGPGRTMDELRKTGPKALLVADPTGVVHSSVEWHLSDSQAQMRGEPRAFQYAALSRNLMAHLLTNWMGDDGFIKKFNWRHLSRTALGDTLIGRGKVTNKRVENGEHLVDLAVWAESTRGNITEAAVATVSLCSREAPYKWK